MVAVDTSVCLVRVIQTELTESTTAHNYKLCSKAVISGHRINVLGLGVMKKCVVGTGMGDGFGDRQGTPLEKYVVVLSDRPSSFVINWGDI